MANPRPGTRPPWVDDDLFPFQSRFVEIDGHLVHHVDEGEGPTLLLYHGNPTWSFLYRDVIAGLRDRFRCVAFDYPGFGLSSAAEGYGFTVAEHAAVAERFVELLDLTDVTYFGQDWGGPIGTAAAVRHPERYRAVVLGSTWAWPWESISGKAFSFLGGGPVGWLLIVKRNLFVERVIPSAHVRRTLTDAEMDHYRGPFPDEASRKPVWVMPREITKADALLAETATGLPRIAHLPALLLWAGADRMFGDPIRQRWERELPSHHTHVLEGAGHYWQDDAAAEVVEVFGDWWPPEPAG